MLEIEQQTKIVTMQFRTEVPKDRLKDHFSEEELVRLRTEFDATEMDCRPGEQTLLDIPAQYQKLAKTTRTSRLLTVKDGKATIELVSDGKKTSRNDYGSSATKLEKPGDVYYSYAFRPDFEAKTAFVSELVACVRANS